MRAVVIGGGVIGLTTAYQLVREGVDVVVLDAGATGRGASAINAGWFVPAEALPVPGPKMVARTLRWMLRPDSPVYVRPSPDPAFAMFMLRMWRRCNARDQRAGFEAHLRLAEGTAGVLDEYRADGIAFEMHSAGLLMAFTDRENLEHHRRTLDLASAYGREPEVLVGDDVRAYEPKLSDRVHGGIRFPHERHLDPRGLVEGLHARLAGLGAQILENQAVTAVERRGSVVSGVVTASGRHTGDVFVLAAGAWTGGLSRRFGVPLPVRPGKGYSVDVPSAGLRGATNLSDAKVALTPYADRLRIAGTMEFGGLDENVNQVRVAAILRAPGVYLRDWEPPPGPLTARAGMRPMTPDGLPVVGRLGDLTNAYVTSGHGMLGVTLAPGSARALAGLVVHGKPQPVLDPFSPDRF